MKHIEFALDHFAADVLVGQSLTYGSIIASARRRLPVASLGFCTYLWPTEQGFNEQSEIAGWKRWRYENMAAQLNDLFRLYRLEAYESSCWGSPLLADLFLVRSVPELEPSPGHLPAQVHLVGNCLWEPTEHDAEFEAWCSHAANSGAPVVYVQQGRSFELPSFWPTVMEVLEKLGCRVAASVDKMDGDVGAFPPAAWVRPRVPQATVLRHAALVVASATTTSFLGALSAGIPCLLLPGGGEQPDVAALAEQAGVALTIRLTEATPERIEGALRRLLTEGSFRERAQWYRQAFAEVDSFATAANLIEELGRTRCPVFRPSAEVFTAHSMDIHPCAWSAAQPLIS
ncbi:MAG: hypothetical protein HC897_00480 [Thermoanaerobaculia bacterium]|nr:hypothetical protein [Thermoanaerobaculia bacterium]